MKRYIPIILLLIIVKQADGQSTANYIDYHKHITVAEQQFLYFNTPSGAIKKYKEIFAKWEKPFAKDCFIALQLACMMKDTASATFFFTKCFENGVEWNTVMISDYVRGVFHDIIYKKKIALQYDNLHKKYIATLDTLYRNVIYRMLKNETTLRSAAEYGPNGRSETLVAQWIKLEDSNMYALIPMIQNKGFPGEKQVGYYYYTQINDDRIGDKRHEYDFNMVDIFLSSHIAIMFYHHRCGYQLLKEELMQAVIEGELHPREYAVIYEWSHAYFLSKHWDDDLHDYKCESGKWEKRYNLDIHDYLHSKDVDTVNKHRAEIGISTLAHDEKKKQYAIDNGLYLYFGMFQKV